jgi:hypothetical protein
MNEKSDFEAVCAWLSWKWLANVVDLFRKEEIDGEAFFALNDSDFDRLKLTTGSRKKISAKVGGSQLGKQSPRAR